MGDARLHDRRHSFASVAAVPEELRGRASRERNCCAALASR